MSKEASVMINADSVRNRIRTPHIPTRKQKLDTTIKVVSMDAVVVTGARNEVLLKDSPVRVDLIDASRLRNSASPNLASVLQEQAGIGLSNGLHAGVQLMGLSADYTQILVDGMPLIGRVAGVIDLNRISVSNVSQVEIVKGPMSSLYGSEALAGVINLISRKPAPGLSFGAFSQFMFRQGIQASFNLGYSIDDVDASFFIDARSAPPFELSSDSITIPYSGFKDLTLQSRLRWFVLPKLSLSANARYFQSHSVGKFVQTFLGQIAANEGSVDQQDLGVNLAADWISGRAHLKASVYISAYKETYQFDVQQGSVGSEDDFKRGLVRPSVQYDVLWNDKNRLMLGLEYSYDDLRGTRYPQDPFYRTFVSYVQWEGNPTSWVSYALSARFDANHDFGNNLSPKFSSLFKVNDQVGIRLSVGTGFKAPDFRQLYVLFRNNLQGAGYVLSGARLLGRDLFAERSLSYESSVYWSDDVLDIEGRKLRVGFDARVFYNSLKNLIEYYLDHIEAQTSVYSYRNISRVRTLGLECTANALYPLSVRDTMQVSIGYQYLDAVDIDVLDAIDRNDAGTVDRLTGSFIPLTRNNYGGLWFRSTHLVNLRADYRNADGWSANFRADFVGRFGDQARDINGSVLRSQVRSVPDLDIEYVPAYWNLKCSANKFVSLSQSMLGIRSVQFGAGVVNILNVTDLRSLPSLFGRQWYLNIRCEW